MVFDLRLKDNFKLFVGGPSGSGKTSLIVDLITNLNKIAINPPKKAIYFYKEWQDKFDFMQTSLGVLFIEDNDNIIDQVQQFEEPSLVIFDDMMNSSNLKAVAQLFTVHGRHMNLSLAFLSQRLFNNNDYFRQISQNCDYMCIFKNPRNSMEIRSLASQITPKTLDLVNIYQKATQKPYSYIFINLTQECIPQLKYLSDLFSQNHIIHAYVLTNCKA